MGNRTNLLTIRPNNQLNHTRLNFNEFWYSYSISKLFGFLFLKKKMFLTKLNLFLVENKLFLTFFVFFRVAKFIKLVKKLKGIPEKKIKPLKIGSLFKSFNFLKKNLIIYTIVNLNFFLKKKKKKNFTVI